MKRSTGKKGSKDLNAISKEPPARRIDVVLRLLIEITKPDKSKQAGYRREKVSIHP